MLFPPGPITEHELTNNLKLKLLCVSQLTGLPFLVGSARQLRSSGRGASSRRSVFCLSSHALDRYGKIFERAEHHPLRDLAANPANRFRLAGIVVGRKERTSAKGNRFAFVAMSDASGLFEVTLFSDVLGPSRALLDGGQALLVTVELRAEEDNLRLTASKVEPLDAAVAHAAAGLKIVVGPGTAIPELKSAIAAGGHGRGRVAVVVPLDPVREVEIVLPGGYKIGPSTRSSLRALPGILEVHDL